MCSYFHNTEVTIGVQARFKMTKMKRMSVTSSDRQWLQVYLAMKRASLLGVATYKTV